MEISIFGDISQEATKERESGSCKNLIEDLVQEIITQKNPILKPGYGTEFMSKLGEVVNIHKIRFFVNRSMIELSKKYPVKKIYVDDARLEGDKLILVVSVETDLCYESLSVQIDWNGKIFTEEDIIE